MKISKFLPAFLAGACMMLTACDKNDVNADTPDVPQKGDTRAAVELNNNFAFNLFKEYSAAKQDNGALSPLSVFTCLSMLANGDDGEMRDEILKVLGYQNGDRQLELLNDYYKEMADVLTNADSNTIFTMGNAIWVSDIVNVLPEYDAFLKDTYNSESFSFNDPVKGQEDVNNWIFDKTNGIIKDFLTSPLNSLVTVVNANYFKGEWSSKFDVELTCTRNFYNIDNTVCKVDMMSQYNEWAYTETEDYQLANLPYGNGSFEMTLVLPKPETDIDKVIAKFDNKELTSALDKAKKENFFICMPNCKISDKFNIFENLEKIGLRSPLNLNRILASQNAGFGMMLHGVDIEIGEDGTTAAAVTAVTGFGGSMTEHYPEGIICNRPFFFMIREVSTGTILYMGKVVKFEE